MSTLCKAEESTLLIIDPQERLVPAMHEGAAMVNRCVQLAMAARELKIPVIATEQNPAALGANVPPIREWCDLTTAKFDFSAAADASARERLPVGRSSIVVAGCEAHVCVLQTVADLLDAGRSVRLVVDAIASRHPLNRDAAIARASRMGADLVTTEMVLFEWLRSSRHPSFKTISRLIR